MATKELTTKTNGQLKASSPEVLLQRAIDKGLPVETMERIVALFEKMKAEQAKEAFVQSMSAFQAKCPTIKKTTKVSFVSKRTGQKTNYNYAQLDDIDEQTKELRKKYGFSHTFDTKEENNKVTAICTVTHIQGHSKPSSFTVPIDPDAYMNAQQKFASALTFAKRYAFQNAFGILTGDEDDDSRASSNGLPKQAPKLNNTPNVQTKLMGDATEKQKNKIHVMCSTHFNVPWTRTHANKFFKEKLEVEADVNNLNKQEASEIINRLEVMREEQYANEPQPIRK